MIESNAPFRTNYSSVAGGRCSSRVVALAGVGWYGGVFHT